MKNNTFDDLIWRQIRASLEKKRAKIRSSVEQTKAADIDYKKLDDKLNALREDLELGKYHAIRQRCRVILTAIEKNIADDVTEELQRATREQKADREPSAVYRDALHLYQKTLRALALELILHTKNIKEIEPNFTSYQALRQEMQREISKVAYLFGKTDDADGFSTSADVEELDTLMRQQNQFLLKHEFFKQFQLVIQALGPLDRNDFHKVTEPYKNLRKMCQHCLEILTLMKDSRFFGKYDTFIEDYEHDVQIYLHILWYLAIKTDLNKIDKFLNPNTYTKGMDEYCQIFAALTLLGNIIPNIKEARAVGLHARATGELLEIYAEHLYLITRHEREQERLPDDFDGIHTIIERHTKQHMKTGYRIDFAIKLFKKRAFAFKLGGHKRIAVPNPDGRILRKTTTVEQALDAFQNPVLVTFFEHLKHQYHSRDGLKVQRLRWSWFAERKLPEGYFADLKYDYLKYIHTRWQEKTKAHYRRLRHFFRKAEDDD